MEHFLRTELNGFDIKCGLYKSADGLIVNADLNGSANILTKVASFSSLRLTG